MKEVYFLGQQNNLHQSVETAIPTLEDVFWRLEEALSIPSEDRGRILTFFPGYQNYDVKYLNLINNNHQFVAILILHNWNHHLPSDKVIEIYTLSTSHNELFFGDRAPIEVLLDMFTESKITI